jgi:hypothetical protein
MADSLLINGVNPCDVPVRYQLHSDRRNHFGHSRVEPIAAVEINIMVAEAQRRIPDPHIRYNRQMI